MAVSKADMGEKNPVEYQNGARRAREARSHVAQQLGSLIETADLTGSHDFVARRVRSYVDALREGDVVVIRSALMDLGAAVGATVADLDLNAPPAQRAA